MGLFSKSAKHDLPWNNVKSVEELTDIFDNEQDYVLFKHSTRCGISRMALSSFESAWDIENTDLKLYFIDLLAHRDVSNKIAELYNVQHQSPQAIVVKHKLVVDASSHSEINANKIQNL